MSAGLRAATIAVRELPPAKVKGQVLQEREYIKILFHVTEHPDTYQGSLSVARSEQNPCKEQNSLLSSSFCSVWGGNL